MIRLFFAIGALAFAQHGSISGTVIQSNGDPVRKAIVTLTWQGTPRTWARLRTDSSGRFEFDGLPPGKYDLRANKIDAGTAVYGAASTHELGEFLTLDDGEAIRDIKLKLIAPSTVRGRVLDPDGDPVIGVNVSLMRQSRNLGERVAVNYRGATTNDRGEYHIAGVEPGQYYLHVATNLGRMVAPQSMLASQYYGGAADWKDSSPITIRSGDSVSGMDFHLNAVQVVKFSGRVTGLPDSDPPSDPARHRGNWWVQVTLSLVGEPMMQSGVGVQAEGRFQFPEVPAGRYRIRAIGNADGKNYTASQIIDVQPGMGDVSLALAADVTVKGHLTVEGKTDQKPSSFEVGMNSMPNRTTAHVKADGTFEIQVSPGEWEFNLNPLPRGAYLKSLRFGDKDVRFERIPIEPGTNPLINVVISMNTATIQGEIEAKRAGIVLAPLGELHDLARYYYGIPTDDKGKFKLTGIAPGKYKIFAIEKMAAATFRNPEAADQLGDLGEVVDLAEGTVVTVHPKLIPAERAREILP